MNMSVVQGATTSPSHQATVAAAEAEHKIVLELLYVLFKIAMSVLLGAVLSRAGIVPVKAKAGISPMLGAPSVTAGRAQMQYGL